MGKKKLSIETLIWRMYNEYEDLDMSDSGTLYYPDMEVILNKLHTLTKPDYCHGREPAWEIGTVVPTLEATLRELLESVLRSPKEYEHTTEEDLKI